MMQTPSQTTSPASAARVEPVLLDASWPQADDDLALGCECADPALQIDHWPGEARPFMLAS